MIDHDLKVIFIPNMKCASSSIAKSLFIKKHRKYHCTARWFKEQYGRYWDEYFTFAFVRNIWDMLVSWYCYMGQTSTKHSFTRFIKNIDNYKPIQQWEFKGLYDRVSDENGKVMIDFVGKVENIENDFKKVCDRLGLTDRRLIKINSSKRTNYKVYYNKETEFIVRRKYADDVKHFGYEF